MPAPMAPGDPLTPDEFEAWRTLEYEAGADGFLDFVPLISPGWKRPYHLRPLADILDRAIRFGGVRATSSVPPRFAKTETILHSIARGLLLRPEMTFAYVSYEAGIAHTKSRRARDIALRAGIGIRDDINALREWRTPQGGGLLATGIGGPLNAMGVDCLIIDDPIKNRLVAESPTYREAAFDWLTSTGATRVEPGGSILVNMTRWHPDDMIGRLESDASTVWEILNLPAVDQFGRSLWPERWSDQELDARKRLVGEYDWASLFMGAPRPRGQTLFREPARYRFPQTDGIVIVIACDPAATADTRADYSVAMVLAFHGRGVNLKCDILDCYRAQVEIPELVRVLCRMQETWDVPIAVEAVAGFKAVPQQLKEINRDLRIVSVTPRGDKFTRALPSSAAWNDSRIRVPYDVKQNPWVPELIKEFTRFTGVKDATDDQVDCLSTGYNAYIENAGRFVRRGSVPVRGA